MMGDRAKAQAMYQRVPSLVNKNSSVDPIVAQQAQRYLASGGHFAAFELLYIRRDLAKMEKETPELLQLLEKSATETGAVNPVVADSKKDSLSSRFRSISLGNKSNKSEAHPDFSADNRASYLMLKGSMLKGLGKGEEAIACFREVFQLESATKEKYFVPYSLYELAECLYHNNNLKEAQEIIKKCNNVSGYAWEDPLKVRLRVTMDQLKHGGVSDDTTNDDPLPSSLPTIGVATNGAEPPSPPPPSSTTTKGDPEEVVVAENSAPPLVAC